jgi:ribonuclease P protein component
LVAQTGCRVRRGSLVLSMVAAPADGSPVDGVGAGQPRAAAIAGRRVGPAVTRNRVKRRLRELLRDRLVEQPVGSLVVVRALPGAERASYQQLGRWMDAGLRACRSPSPAGSRNG